MSKRLLGTVEKLIRKQAELWQHSMEQAQSKWTSIGNEAEVLLRNSLSESILTAHQSVQKPIVDFHAQLSNHQSDSIERIGEAQLACLEQLRGDVAAFQSKLSEQIQSTIEQQDALQKLTSRILELSENTSVIAAMEEPIQRVLHRMTDIDRFHDAAICLTEAVAVLGTQLERHGYIGRTTARRRTSESTEDTTVEPNVIPMKRKADEPPQAP